MSPYRWFFAILTFVLALIARNLIFRIRRMNAKDVTAVRLLDKRPPIILLRSFSDDLTPVRTSVSERNPKMDPQDLNPIGDAESWTLEQSLERLLLKYGPVIAIGRPGEKLPPLGAAREYVENDKWRAKVEEYVGTAGYVVFILGASAGLEYEYSLVGRLDALERTILVFPPANKKQSMDRWYMFCQAAHVDPDAISPETVAKTIVLGFRDDNRPYAVTGDRRRMADTYELGLTYWLLWQGKSTGEHRTEQRLAGCKQPGSFSTPEAPRKKRQRPKLSASILYLALSLILLCLYGLWIAADTNDVQLLFNQSSDLLFGSPAPISFAAIALLLLALHGLLVGLIYRLLRVPHLIERYRPKHGASRWFLDTVCLSVWRYEKKWPVRRNLRRMVYRLPFYVVLLLPVMTLFIFWARTLVMHDWRFTTICLVAFLFSLSGFIWLSGMGKWMSTADAEGIFPLYPAGSKACLLTFGLRFLAASLVMVTLSFGAIDGVNIALTSAESPCKASKALYSGPNGGICNVNSKAFPEPHIFTPFQVGVPRILGMIGFRAFADISGAAVSPMKVEEISAIEEQHARQQELAEGTLLSLDLRFAMAERILLTGANLRHTDFRGARLVKADLREADLRGADFRGSVLIKADLRNASLQGVDMRFCVAPEADFRSTLLQGIRLESATLIAAKLQGASLERTKLENAFLVDAQLQGALLREAQLRNAVMYSAHLEGSDLAYADLTSATIAYAHLNGADLRKAILTDTELQRTDLEGAVLREANLTDSNLTGANLAGADLTGANLKNTVLKKARFCRTIMPDGVFKSGGCLQPFP